MRQFSSLFATLLAIAALGGAAHAQSIPDIRPPDCGPLQIVLVTNDWVQTIDVVAFQNGSRALRLMSMLGPGRTGRALGWGVYSTMRSILLVDHGSVREEANHMLLCAANLLQHMVGDDVIVGFAHMELSEPTIAQGFANCVRDGATEVIVFPYMLSPGKHVTRDVPRLVAEAALDFPEVSYRMTQAFGIHEKLSELIAMRAGVDIVAPLGASEGCQCWEPTGGVGSCGIACAARASQSETSASAP